MDGAQQRRRGLSLALSPPGGARPRLSPTLRLSLSRASPSSHPLFFLFPCSLFLVIPAPQGAADDAGAAPGEEDIGAGPEGDEGGDGLDADEAGEDEAEEGAEGVEAEPEEDPGAVAAAAAGVFLRGSARGLVAEAGRSSPPFACASLSLFLLPFPSCLPASLPLV